MLNYKIKIFDNFLNDKDFQDLICYAQNLKINREIHVFHNEIETNDNIINSSIDHNLLLRLNKNYLQKAKKILEELNQDKAKLIDYSDFTIIRTNKNAKFPIHDDNVNKLLSGVIYLFPEKNTGTIFYNSKKGDNKTIIDWKPNRAVFFSRKERETWHSYEGDGVNDRIALVYNLMTFKKNIKKVLEIEKKNYFYSNLRFNLNPYIYRIFKKII